MDEREVELQRARRQGFDAGYHAGRSIHPANQTLTQVQIESLAAELYPITVRRPRVVHTQWADYRVSIDGRFIEMRPNAAAPWHNRWFSMETLRAMTELLAQPTEDVTE